MSCEDLDLKSRDDLDLRFGSWRDEKLESRAGFHSHESLDLTAVKIWIWGPEDLDLAAVMIWI